MQRCMQNARREGEKRGSRATDFRRQTQSKNLPRALARAISGRYLHAARGHAVAGHESREAAIKRAKPVPRCAPERELRPKAIN